MIALINLLLILSTVESYPRGHCPDYDSSGIVRFYCCFNYVEIDGVCTECLDGFESFDGFQCRPCPRGFYGKTCLWRCFCKMNEKCDHVQGCLKILPTTEAVTEHDHVEGTSSSAVESTTEINRKRGRYAV